MGAANRGHHSSVAVYSHNYNKGRGEFSFIPNLSPKQRYKIDQICLERDRKLDKLNFEKRELRIQLSRIEKRPYLHKKQIDKLRNRIYKIDKEISKTRYKADDKIFSLLTRQQQQLYIAYHNNKRR